MSTRSAIFSIFVLMLFPNIISHVAAKDAIAGDDKAGKAETIKIVFQNILDKLGRGKDFSGEFSFVVSQHWEVSTALRAFSSYGIIFREKTQSTTLERYGEKVPNLSYMGPTIKVYIVEDSKNRGQVQKVTVLIYPSFL